MGVGDEELLHEVLPLELDAGALDPQAQDLEDPGDDLQEADPVARPDHEAGGVRIVVRRVEDGDERAVGGGDGVILSRAADAAAGIGEARRSERSGAGRGKDAGPVWGNVQKREKGRSGDGEHRREMAAVVRNDNRRRVRCVYKWSIWSACAGQVSPSKRLLSPELVQRVITVSSVRFNGCIN